MKHSAFSLLSARYFLLVFFQFSVQLCMALAAQAAAADDIQIFTTQRWPVQSHPKNTTVYTLALPDDLTATLFGKLADNPQAAAQQAHHIMASPVWQQAEQALYNNAEGVTKAWALGVQKLPAVVIAGKYVVYGGTDVAIARQKLVEFQGRR